ncbi:MAG: DUF3336 domain-containing protein [Pseudomonadota bacterium]|nr:DUF3336 domain-containing protein [Pseudomonadota bacterium]
MGAQLTFLFEIEAIVMDSLSLSDSLSPPVPGSPRQQRQLPLQQLEQRLQTAGSYSDWLQLAREYDQLSGAERWREREESRLYDYAEVRARRNKLRNLLNAGAHRELLYALNEGIHGNMAGMGRPLLYERARCGTKQLIHSYVAAMVQALEFIHQAPEAVISYAEKLDFFRRASHCYGRSALLLSGGAGLIYFHHGVVQELMDQDLLPNVISGSSAGSIICGQLGSQTDAELRAGYFTHKRYVEPTQTHLLDVVRGRITEQEAKVARERLLDEVVPLDLTFQEAFEHTGRYINISISPMEKHQTSRLMNAITSPNVFIRSAVSASSSIPGLMAPERLFAKGFDGKPRPYLASRRWVDGSVAGDLPAKRLMRLYGVNHFIVSQINPLVVPFLRDGKARRSQGYRGALNEALVKLLRETLVKSERLLDQRGELGNRAAAQLAYIIRMLDQDYLGDINILLDKADIHWRHIFFDYRPGETDHLVQLGRRATWANIPRIKNAALVSKALDRILEDLNQTGLQDQAGHIHHLYT